MLLTSSRARKWGSIFMSRLKVKYIYLVWILHDSEKRVTLSIWLCVCVQYKGDKLFSVDHFSGKQPFVPLLLSPLASSYAHTSHTLSSITVIDGCSIFIPLCIEQYPFIYCRCRLRSGKHKGTTSCAPVRRPSIIHSQPFMRARFS